MSKEMIDNNSQEVDINIDELLGVPGAGSVVTPDEEKETKTTVLTNKKDTVTEFLDNLATGGEKEPEEEKKEPEEEKKEPEEKPEEKQEPEEKKEPAKEEEKPDAEPETPSEKKKYKSVSSVFGNLIENGVLLGYEDKDNIDDYTQEELESLVQDNIAQIRKDMEESVVKEFINGLPEEFSQAWQYYQSGGKDLKTFLRTIGNVSEVKDLDIENKNDQKTIIREYLKAKEWGSDDEIEDEINDIDDRGDLKKKAEKYKPMLEASQQKIVEQKLQKQEQLKKERQEAVRVFKQEVKDIVNADTLNGIPMDQKIRDMLYVGLVDSSYDSITGSKTNKLGSLLERYQFGKEKNMSLVAEALWLLADPKSYRNNVMNVIIKSQSQNTLRKLKTEQQSSKNTTTQPEEKRQSIPRRSDGEKNKRNFFDFSR